MCAHQTYKQELTNINAYRPPNLKASTTGIILQFFSLLGSLLQILFLTPLHSVVILFCHLRLEP